MSERSTFLAFAYGSNLSTVRLRARTPSARSLTRAWLPEHTLQWHKRGKDGSGKCDATFTGSPLDVLWGALYEIRVDEKWLLDRAEGLRAGYEEKRVAVLTARGRVHAWMYFATDIDASLAPYHWYKRHVLAGAREHDLPIEHIRTIERVASCDDPDQDRVVANELRGG